MNSKRIISALIAITLSTSGLAFADDHGNRNDRGRKEQSRGNGHGNDNRQMDRRDHRGGDRNFERRDVRRDMRRDERGAGPNHSFYKGGRLPHEYRNRQYVVDDWRGHRLSAPPRGYHWVQTGGDYVLVAIATGVILQLLLNN